MSRFTTYLPTDRLKPYINYYGISESETQQVYKVLPSTGLVIGFQYRGQLSGFIGETESPLNSLGVTGLQDHVNLFKNTCHTGSVLVYFNEMGAAAFFREPLDELFAQSLSLDTSIAASILERFEAHLKQATDDQQRIGLVEQFLLAQLRAFTPDRLVNAAVQQIYRSEGSIRIKQLAAQLHTSQSPLEKRFRKLVGATPKKFTSIVRFQSLLTKPDRGLTLTEIAYQFGYYDQSHFIKEFKNFTGETPLQFGLLHRVAY